VRLYGEAKEPMMLKFSPFQTESSAAGAAHLRAPFAMTMMMTTITATMRGGCG